MLSVEGITKSFNGINVLQDVSFTIEDGEILGLVGASGSGKSTIARSILGLEWPDTGKVLWEGKPVSERRVRRKVRRDIQTVFQDPRASLNPRWTVRHILCEPLDNWSLHTGRAKRLTRLEELLVTVSLSPDLLARYPHELSTGQCQRLCVARALAPEPKLLVLDEPLSALDVSVQAQILAMFATLYGQTGLSFLIITHDFDVVRDICHRVVVLDAGQVVETGGVEDVLDKSTNAETLRLLQDVLPLPFVHREISPAQGGC